MHLADAVDHRSSISRLVGLLAGAFLSALVLAPSASALAVRADPSHGPRLLGTFSTPAESDGSRFAAWEDGGVTQIIDDMTRTRRSVVRPAGCPRSAHLYDLNNTGVIYPEPMLGGGLLAWGCRDGSPWSGPGGLQILDLRTGVVADATDAFSEAANGTYDAFPVGLGRHWLAVSVTGLHFAAETSYVNLRTLAVAYDDQRRPAYSMDLNAVGLERRMCAPLQRVTVPADPGPPTSDVSDPFEPFEYERPFGLTIGGRNLDELLLERCGARAAVVRVCPVDDGGTGIVSSQPFQLGAGIVTCTGGDRVTAIDAASGRSRTWRIRGASGSVVVHTARRVLVSVGAGSRWRVYTIPMPRLHGVRG